MAAESSSSQDDHKSRERSPAFDELKREFGRLLETAFTSSSHQSSSEKVIEIGHKLERMFVYGTFTREMCRLCLKPVPAGTRYGLFGACDHAHCEPCLRGWIIKNRCQAPNSKTVSCPTCDAQSSRALFDDTFLVSKCDEFEDDCEKADKLDAVLYVEQISADSEEEEEEESGVKADEDEVVFGVWVARTRSDGQRYFECLSPSRYQDPMDDDDSSSQSTSSHEDRKPLDRAIAELKDKFARLLETAVNWSQLSPEEMAKQVGRKLPHLFDTLASKKVESSKADDAQSNREMCRICLEAVPAGTRYGLLEACDHAHCEPCLRGWMAESRRQAPNSKTVSCPTCRAVSSRALFNKTLLSSTEKAAQLNTMLHVQLDAI